MRDLVTDAGERNKTAEGNALIEALAPHKAQQEASLAEAERPRSIFVEPEMPSGLDAAQNTRNEEAARAAARTRLPESEIDVPTFSEVELLRMRASGYALTPEAETYIAAKEAFKREDAKRAAEAVESIRLRAPEVAQGFVDAYEVDLRVREKRVETRAAHLAAWNAYRALRRQAYAAGVMDESFPQVDGEAEIEARLSHPNHDRIHALRRAEGTSQ